jgi:hypothetical protein
MPAGEYPTGIVAGTDAGKAWNVPFLIITVLMQVTDRK